MDLDTLQIDKLYTVVLTAIPPVEIRELPVRWSRYEGLLLLKRAAIDETGLEHYEFFDHNVLRQGFDVQHGILFSNSRKVLLQEIKNRFSSQLETLKHQQKVLEDALARIQTELVQDEAEHLSKMLKDSLEAHRLAKKLSNSMRR